MLVRICTFVILCLYSTTATTVARRPFLESTFNPQCNAICFNKGQMATNYCLNGFHPSISQCYATGRNICMSCQDSICHDRSGNTC